jgi:two-component system, NtrC family, sensor kinase
MRMLLTICLFFLCSRLHAQQAKADSLEIRLQQATGKERVILLNQLTKAYWYNQLDRAFQYNEEALVLSRQLSDRQGAAEAYRCRGVLFGFRKDTSSGSYLFEALSRFRQLNDKRGIAATLNNLNSYYTTKKDYANALDVLMQSRQLFTELRDREAMGAVNNAIGNTYVQLTDYPHALQFFLDALAIRKEIGDQPGTAFTLSRIGDMYAILHQLPEALRHYEEAYTLSKKVNRNPNIFDAAKGMGNVYKQMGKFADALKYYTISLEAEQAYYGRDSTAISYNLLGQLYLDEHQYTPARMNLEKAYEISAKRDPLQAATALYQLGRLYRETGNKTLAKEKLAESFDLASRAHLKNVLRNSSLALSQLFAEEKNFQQAYSYFTIYSGTQDSLMNEDLNQKMAALQYSLDIRNKQVQIDLLTREKQLQDSELLRQRQQRYIYIGGIILVVLLALTLVYNNRQKQKTNRLLTERSEQISKKNLELQNAYALLSQSRDDISTQRDHLEETLTQLRATQDQLVQSEKMASLGELTAGIAHEIQNPLNFVNNFSEVSVELIEELKAELQAGHTEAAIALSAAVEDNLSKISNHGHRADAIVKSMLQHSRNTTGKKEKQDLNALMDEFLRLSYHGFRAKEKNFNATLETHFDKELGLVDVIPQDMGRVLLNLFNNAFYSVQQKKKQAGDGFQPVVRVGTKRVDGWVIISVRDNGLGIPQKLRDKIYQPFFTTKPTGDGTGLGLSLSYDIITKGHGGHMTMNTREGEFAEFIIDIPDTE